MDSLITTPERIEIVRQLPRRLQRRCEGLNPVALRLTLEAMQVPEREILQCAPPPPPPPPMGLSRSLWTPGLPSSYPNMWQWLRPSVVIAIGGNLVSWPDQSGSGNHATSVTASPPPTTGATINGQPAITFGASIEGASTATVAPTVFYNVSLFYVLQPISLTAFYRVAEHFFQTSWSLALNVSATAWKFGMASPNPPYGLCEGGTPTIGAPTLITATFTGATHTAILQVNGTTVSTDTTMPAPTSSVVQVVTKEGGAASFVDGIPALSGESGIYTDVKTGVALLNLNRYWGNLYGISVP